jgi:ADP-ribose pyrophosphatase YjhB (NUDIX family)
MPKPNDIVFERDGKKFNFRAVAVFEHHNRILLHRVGNNPYWSLPGGRVELLESSADSILREVREELAVEATMIRPLWIMENFFNAYGFDFHEIASYFLLSVPQELITKGDSFETRDGSTTLHFKWHEVKDLENTELFPAFLRTSLAKLPEHLEFIVHRD